MFGLGHLWSLLVEGVYVLYIKDFYIFRLVEILVFDESGELGAVEGKSLF